MRPQSVRKVDEPDTVRYRGHGMCETCLQLTTVPVPTTVDNVPLEQVRYIKRAIRERYDDPDDRLLLIEALGIGGDL
jgi:hypothetical protein